MPFPVGRCLCAVVTGWVVSTAPAPAQGRFPPDSLVNVQVIPKTTPVINVIGIMRNFSGSLGVRCQYCHIGEEGLALDSFNFTSDEKRTKQTARLMMQMVAEVNRRLDSIPSRPTPSVQVTCETCHRGVARPMPLTDLLADVIRTGGADSAQRAYRALRREYFGQASYDFGESTLNILAGRLARQNNVPAALEMIRLNGEFFPNASSVPATTGDIHLIARDTTRAIAEYRRAVAMDGNQLARARLAALGIR